MRAIPLFALLHLVGSCHHCGTLAAEPDSGLVENDVPDGRLDPEWVRLRGSWYFPSPRSEAFRRSYEELRADASGAPLFQASNLAYSIWASSYQLTLTGDTLELRLAEELVERKRYIVIEEDAHHMVIRAWMERTPALKEVIEFTVLENRSDLSSPQFRARFGVERLVANLER